jgi:CheY-like chemotaxis protein
LGLSQRVAIVGNLMETQQVAQHESYRSPPRTKCERDMKTVLLIDDSKFLRRANELAIARSGFGVLTAADGEEGLRIAREKAPDIVVLDMMLPKLSGPELLQALKEDPRTAQIPVIVLSSLPQSNEAKLKSQGAAAYFEKSKLGIEDGSAGLIRTIEGLLRQLSKQG